METMVRRRYIYSHAEHGSEGKTKDDPHMLPHESTNKSIPMQSMGTSKGYGAWELVKLDF